jgi:hypothetical protein
MSLPEKPALEGLEAKLIARWEEAGVYRFDRSRSRADVFSIDTPPPTVSGSLHVGHVFSYTHTDLEQMSPSQLRLELMLTQRLIQSRLGVSTLLFRPPYGVDDEAVSPVGLE